MDLCKNNNSSKPVSSVLMKHIKPTNPEIFNDFFRARVAVVDAPNLDIRVGNDSNWNTVLVEKLIFGRSLAEEAHPLSEARLLRNHEIGRWLSMGERRDASAMEVFPMMGEEPCAVLPPPRRYFRKSTSSPKSYVSKQDSGSSQRLLDIDHDLSHWDDLLVESRVLQRSEGDEADPRSEARLLRNRRVGSWLSTGERVEASALEAFQLEEEAQCAALAEPKRYIREHNEPV